MGTATSTQKNVYGKPLQPCCMDPVTGFFRDGFCHTMDNDLGRHIVCALMTEEFLNFSLSKGNDLITPNLEWGFPGLKPGDRWCLCAERWKEALKAGVAPPVFLEACHQQSLDIIPLTILQQHAMH
ncbi:DUF2237 family protein [Endozoicomonas ascidiicola]|uniref:DUF2237 family protein n=1 Tax=Endozoicomonas ascidiicola TaxID=1698521 RepID=UPI0008362BDC|nr:DUF2237 domain-containing protein [Endozoicomonas ascidiicola]